MHLICVSSDAQTVEDKAVDTPWLCLSWMLPVLRCQTCWSAASKITPCSGIMQCTELALCCSLHTRQERCQGEEDRDRTSLMCISD